MAWLTTYEPIEQNTKDVFKLYLYFSDNIGDDELLAQLEAQSKMHREYFAVCLKKITRG